MHAVAAFFASIITFVSGFFAPTVASNSPVNVRMMQPAAAAAAQTDITGDPFNDAAAASAVAAALAAAPSSAVSPPPAQTVINQPVIERIIERVVPQGGTISASALTAILADFEQSISNRIATLNPPPAAIPAQVAAGGNAGGYGFFPASQRIDQLTKTAINSPTITGGTISGAFVSGYLPLSGGTLTGALSGTDLSLSGNLTAGTLSVAGLSSSGALFAPYFSATSTTATSTFAGGLTAASLAFNILQNGNVGIGTTTPGAALTVAGSGSSRVNVGGFFGSGYGAISLNGTADTTNYNFLSGNSVTDNSLYLNRTSGGAIHFREANGADQLTILTGGNVGIGTTTPATKLDVRGSGDVLTIGGESAATHKFGFDGVGNPYIDGINTNKLLFRTAGSDRIAIDSSGNVGIGTTTPGAVNATSKALRLSNTVMLQNVVGDQALFSNNAYHSSGGWLYLTSAAASAIRMGAPVAGDIAFHVAASGTAGNTIPNWDSSDIRMMIKNTGNVGIGTTSPPTLLTVAGSSGEIARFDSTNANGGYTTWTNGTAPNGIIGSALQLAEAGFSANDFAVRARNNLLFIANGGTSNRYMMWTNAGNFGVGTTTPTAQLTTTGTVRFSNFGAGTLTTDASGNLSVSSDERLKNIDGAFTRGLADIVKLSPIQYHWNALSGLDTSTQYAGFSAQNVQTAIPEAVGSSTNGYLTLQDRPLIATIVNAIKEIASITGTFKSTLIAFLGDADNGIAAIFARDIYATNGDFQHLASDDLCLKRQGGTLICITADQLAGLLSQSAAANLPPSVISHAPVLELNGNASSTIEVSDTYNDLGARIVAPESDLNLGIVTLLDGATTTAVSIDTSTPGEHTILYTVTSPTTGLTGSIMRTVIVAPTAQSPEPPPNDNPFNLVPANDNATSTPVTSWM